MASGIVAIVVSALWGLFGVLMFILAITIDEATDDEEFLGVDDIGDAAAGVLFVVGLVILGCVVWSIIAAAKMLQRQGWGRIATIVNFSIWAFVTVLIAFASLAGSDDDPDTRTIDESSDSNGGAAALWFVHAGACVAVVACAAQRSVSEEIRAQEALTMRSTYGGYGAPVNYGVPGQRPPGYGAPPGQPGYGAPQGQPGYGAPGQVPPGYGGGGPTQPQQPQPPRPPAGPYGSPPPAPPQAPPNALPPSPPVSPPPRPPEPPGPPDPNQPPSWGTPPR
jgi:hypothetical protein